MRKQQIRSTPFEEDLPFGNADRTFAKEYPQRQAGLNRMKQLEIVLFQRMNPHTTDSFFVHF